MKNIVLIIALFLTFQAIYPATQQRELIPEYQAAHQAASLQLLDEIVALRTDEGQTLMHLFAAQNNIASIRLLHLRYPELIAVTNDAEETPLHIAAHYNHPIIIAFCIDEAHVNPNLRDRYGSTALHHAIENNAREAIIALINRNAAINIPDNTGSTALDARTYDLEHQLDSTANNSMHSFVMQNYNAHQSSIITDLFSLAFNTLQRSGGIAALMLLAQRMQHKHQSLFS